MNALRNRQRAYRRTLRACWTGVLLCAGCSLSLAADKPRRIVSINVCTDQLLLTLVQRERIASLSHLARDPHSSWIGDQADGLHLNHGLAEEIVALDPDLVVAAAFSFRPTVGVLKRLGYPVVELPMASSLEDIAGNLRVLAEAVGETESAHTLIATFRAEIEARTYPVTGPRPLFVSYEADGWTSGTDSLVADVARTAGFETLGDRLGHAGGRRVSVEELLILAPHVIDLGHPWDHPPALVSASLKHPALLALLERTLVVDVPDPLWMCGSLRTLEALSHLRQARERLDRAAPRRP